MMALTAAFDCIDENGDGVVDFSEWVTVMHFYHHPMTSFKHATNMVRHMHRKKSSMSTFEKSARWLRRKSGQMAASPASIEPPGLGVEASSTEPHVDDNSIRPATPSAVSLPQAAGGSAASPATPPSGIVMVDRSMEPLGHDSKPTVPSADHGVQPVAPAAPVAAPSASSEAAGAAFLTPPRPPARRHRLDSGTTANGSRRSSIRASQTGSVHSRADSRRTSNHSVRFADDHSVASTHTHATDTAASVRAGSSAFHSTRDGVGTVEEESRDSVARQRAAETIAAALRQSHVFDPEFASSRGEKALAKSQVTITTAQDNHRSSDGGVGSGEHETKTGGVGTSAELAVGASAAQSERPRKPAPAMQLKLGLWELAMYRAMFMRLDTNGRDVLTLEEFLHLPMVRWNAYASGLDGACVSRPPSHWCKNAVPIAAVQLLRSGMHARYVAMPGRCRLLCSRCSHKRWRPLGRIVTSPRFEAVVFVLIVLNVIEV